MHYHNKQYPQKATSVPYDVRLQGKFTEQISDLHSHTEMRR
jgi:hypothetical protein